jgi:hypothetical protein
LKQILYLFNNILLKLVTSEDSAIYTDGSKDGDTVASAAVFGQQVYSPRLLSAISIFSAEYNVMLLALKFVASSDESKFHNQFGFSLFPNGNCKLQKSKSFH